MLSYSPSTSLAPRTPVIEAVPEPGRALGEAALGPHLAMVERTAAAAILLCALPALALASLIVVLLSRRSPLIAHARVGRHGNPIWLLKLRTMWDGRGGTHSRGEFLIERIRREPVTEFKDPCDRRVTSSFAALCRRHSIDELPQLWHVIRGEMSLVGPRPLTSGELTRWYGDDVGEVLRVKPGLTGLWQVMGRNSLTYHQRRRLDLFLLRKWSVRLYVSVLLATIPNVFTGKGAC